MFGENGWYYDSRHGDYNYRPIKQNGCAQLIVGIAVFAFFVWALFIAR